MSATRCNSRIESMAGVEEEQQDERDVIVEVQFTVAGGVAGAADVVQAAQQLGDPAKEERYSTTRMVLLFSVSSS